MAIHRRINNNHSPNKLMLPKYQTISFDVSIDSAEIQINRKHCLNSNTLSMHLVPSKTEHRVIFINLFFDKNTLFPRSNEKCSLAVVSTSHDIARALFSFSLTVFFLVVIKFKLPAKRKKN